MKHELNFENFYIHEGNEIAYLAAQKIIEFPGELFNPFYVHSSPGMGKTHLLKAIHFELSKRFEAQFFSAKEFERFVKENKPINAPLIVDDLPNTAPAVQQQLWLTIDTCLERGIQVCFSGGSAPRDIKDVDAKLLSRLEGGLICDIQPPRESVLVDMIKKKSEEVGLNLSDDVVIELSRVSDGSLRTIDGMVNRLRAYSSLGNLALDIHNARLVLKEFYPKGIYSPVTSIFKELQKNAASVLDDVSGKLNTREEFKDKIYIWEMKGYDTSSLKTALNGDITNLKKEYDRFIKKVEQLTELQKDFGQLDIRKFPNEAIKIESMLFSPDRVDEIRGLVAKILKGMEAEESALRFGSFLIGSSNINAYNIYKKQILQGLGEKFNPFVVLGKDGTGKSHFLKAISEDLKNHKKSMILVDFEKKKEMPRPRDLEDIEVLIIDNFHNITDFSKDERNEIFRIIINHIKADKGVILSSLIFPSSLLLSEEEKIAFELSLEVELLDPSPDLAKAYIRSKLGYPGSQGLFRKGLPKFESFLQIDDYIDSYNRTERDKFVPLGFSGEEDIEPSKKVSVEITAKVDDIDDKQSGKAVVVDINKFILPEIYTELVEENY